MAVREILVWPDPRLAVRSRPVTQFDADLKALAKDMLETMYAAEGVGLAAPQVGVPVRLLVVDIYSHDGERPSGEEPIFVANPVFVERSGELEWEEGCLSVPGETGNVTRSAFVRMQYQHLDGTIRTLTAEGLKAVALQHEVDHLEGKLFVDYLSRVKRNMIRRKMLKLKQENTNEAAA